MMNTLNMEDLLNTDDWQLEQSLGLTLFDDPWKSVDFESTDLKPALAPSGSDDLDQLLQVQPDQLADPLCERWMENAGIAEMLQSLVQDSEDLGSSMDTAALDLPEPSSWKVEPAAEVKGHEILRSLIEQQPIADVSTVEEEVVPTISLVDTSFNTALDTPMSPIHLTDMDGIMHSPLSAEDVESLLSGSEPPSPQSSIAASDTSSGYSSELQAMLLDSSPKLNGKSRTRSTPYSRKGSKSKSSDASEDLQTEFLSKKEKKKLQNKNAAIRYRQKKKQEAEVVKSEENELEDKNKDLKEQVDQLSREIKYMKDLMTEVYKAKGIVKS